MCKLLSDVFQTQTQKMSSNWKINDRNIFGKSMTCPEVWRCNVTGFRNRANKHKLSVGISDIHAVTSANYVGQCTEDT